MENSIFLAKLLGPYLAIVGIGFFTNSKNCQQVIHEYTQSTILIYFGGILALFFGLLIILFHNVWEANWTVIITLFGWIGLIKGACLIIIPEQMKKFALRYEVSMGPAIIQSSIVFIIGMFLMIKGYNIM